MSTILTNQIIVNANAAVEKYKTDASEEVERLENLLKDLTGERFIGDGSLGYMQFFNDKALPQIRDRLYMENNSLVAMLHNALDTIAQQLLNTTDPDIRDYNIDPTANG